jgi:hypothetical protein
MRFKINLLSATRQLGHELWYGMEEFPPQGLSIHSLINKALSSSAKEKCDAKLRRSSGTTMRDKKKAQASWVM